jgi:acetylornithine aminotransferase
MTKAFHGRTMATLTATGNAKAQEGFGPMLSGFTRVPYKDAEAIKAVVSANPNIVAVMLEPVQGEGGLATAEVDYIRAVRDICDTHNLLMMVDEIQTGNGRTGSYFCYQQFDILPDVVTTAKGLGNGVPIGACLARGKAAEVLQPGSHGSTYGGNPLACAAANAVVTTIENDKLAENAAHMGNYLSSAFNVRLQDNPLFKEIRGRGLMLGIVLNQDCTELMAKGTEKGLLLNVTSGNVIRLLPPLTLNEEEADLIVEGVMELIHELNE